MTSSLVLAPGALALLSALVLGAIEHGRPRLARVFGGVSFGAQLLLALAAVDATHRSGADAATLWAVVAGGFATLVLDRLSAWMLVLLALTFALARGTGGGARAGVSVRESSRRQLQLLAMQTACLSGNLLAIGALLLVAVWLTVAASAPGAGPRERRASPVLWLALGIGAAIVGIRIGGGTFDLAGLAAAAPAIPSADAGLLTSCAFALFIALVAVALYVCTGAFAEPSAAHAGPRAPAIAVALSLVPVYAILRIYTLVFPCFIAGPCGPSGSVLPVGLAIVTGGALAALTVTRRRSLAPALVTLSLGTALVAAGTFRQAGLAAALFMMLHTAVAAAALAATSGLSARWRALPVAALLSVPPLSGFVGLVAVLGASVPDALTVWTLMLGSALVAGIGVLRMRQPAEESEGQAAAAGAGPRAGALASIGTLLLLALGAGHVLGFGASTAREMLDRSHYVSAVAAARAPRDDRTDAR